MHQSAHEMLDCAGVGSDQLGNACADRFRPLGAIEAWDCDNTGEGEVPDPIAFPPNATAPPCLIQPPQMWDGNQFPNVNKGKDRLREPPQDNEGTHAATPTNDDVP